MSDTADRGGTQGPSEVIAGTLSRSGGFAARRAPYRDQAECIILALHEAGYIIVPRSAVDAALERKGAAA